MRVPGVKAVLQRVACSDSSHASCEHDECDLGGLIDDARNGGLGHQLWARRASA